MVLNVQRSTLGTREVNAVLNPRDRDLRLTPLEFDSGNLTGLPLGHHYLSAGFSGRLPDSSYVSHHLRSAGMRGYTTD